MRLHYLGSFLLAPHRFQHLVGEYGGFVYHGLDKLEAVHRP